ncbi:hypothetical protein F5Y14DRAFT_130787 [Nemania sp. NC0429]|nr:hypothetical protein F5Y14DRAFT_130787 [Nemania sp. NC0429]
MAWHGTGSRFMVTLLSGGTCSSLHYITKALLLGIPLTTTILCCTIHSGDYLTLPHGSIRGKCWANQIFFGAAFILLDLLYNNCESNREKKTCCVLGLSVCRLV